MLHVYSFTVAFIFSSIETSSNSHIWIGPLLFSLATQSTLYLLFYPMILSDLKSAFESHFSPFDLLIIVKC